MLWIIMGVAGSGKSTIGTMLSQRTGWVFYEGDNFHPPENVEKMSRGIPLNDEDRLPWLLALRDLIDEVLSNQSHAIIACSALKAAYRELLQGEHKEIFWVYLKGDYAQIWSRMQQRQGHFMKAQMLRSQFETLEEPEKALTVSIAESPEVIVNQIVNYLEILKNQSND